METIKGECPTIPLLASTLAIKDEMKRPESASREAARGPGKGSSVDRGELESGSIESSRFRRLGE
jgi:hypothetical protein